MVFSFTILCLNTSFKTSSLVKGDLDSFKIFVKKGASWQKIGQYKDKDSSESASNPETWFTDSYNLPSGNFRHGPKNIEIKFEATGNEFSLFGGRNTWGQLAIDYIKLFSDKYYKVTIVKYLNGNVANSGVSYPMVASWATLNLTPAIGVGNYTLNPSGFYNPNPYYATTADMLIGASYTTYEATSYSPGDILPRGAECLPGRTRLKGYTTGNTLIHAASKNPNSNIPNLTNLTSDKYVIVWNELCDNVTDQNQEEDNY